jgi:hypothetical protein
MATCARADDITEPLAQSGSWVAGDHRMSITDAADVCIASSDAGLGFRYGNGGIEIHMSHDSWTLPAGVAGQFTLVIGSSRHTFSVEANTATMVAANLPMGDAPGLFDEIAEAPAMTVQVGNAKPIPVALDGSKVVLAAFRTCAGINGGNGGGENPFAH